MQRTRARCLIAHDPAISSSQSRKRVRRLDADDERHGGERQPAQIAASRAAPRPSRSSGRWPRPPRARPRRSALMSGLRKPMMIAKRHGADDVPAGRSRRRKRIARAARCRPRANTRDCGGTTTDSGCARNRARRAERAGHLKRRRHADGRARCDRPPSDSRPRRAPRRRPRRPSAARAAGRPAAADRSDRPRTRAADRRRARSAGAETRRRARGPSRPAASSARRPAAVAARADDDGDAGQRAREHQRFVARRIDVGANRGAVGHDRDARRRERRRP